MSVFVNGSSMIWRKAEFSVVIRPESREGHAHTGSYAVDEIWGTVLDINMLMKLEGLPC